VLGHEGAGVVERVGEGVRDVQPGDHVVTLFSPQCRECEHCREPRTNLCLAIREQQGRGLLPDGTTRLSRDGEPIRHFMGTSTFAEATVMPEIALAKVSPEAPLDRACLFACGLSTGLGAAMNTAKVAPGSTCVVFGAGMVGLGAVAGFRLQGAERIVCVDLSEERLELARGQGATDSLVGGPDTVERVVELTGGFGADYTFEATGNVAVMRQAVEAARMGWGLATMCGVAGKGETLDVVPRLLITGRRVAGSSFGGVKGARSGAAARRALARRGDRRRAFRLAQAVAGRGQPRVRADGGPGRHPQRDRLWLGEAPDGGERLGELGRERVDQLEVARARERDEFGLSAGRVDVALAHGVGHGLVVGAVEHDLGHAQREQLDRRAVGEVVGRHEPPGRALRALLLDRLLDVGDRGQGDHG
jgi:S-(hydroxymethyl)glutathione dehydrogenase/alcohol dehydrogenase